LAIHEKRNHVSAFFPIEEAMSDLNDPRVFFAAERTLLAWSRTSITVMVFGFVVERFGLLVAIYLLIELK